MIVSAPDAGAEVGGRRFSGANRFETAVLANREVHQDPGRVFIARGDEFADALTGSFKAGQSRSPLVFTHRDELPPETLEYLRGAQTEVVHLIGGPAAISERVEQQLRDEGVEEIHRQQGTDRFDTAYQGVGSGHELTPELLLVNGYGFADAVTAAPIAYRFSMPIGLTTAEELPEATRRLIEEFRPSRLSVIGGPSVISDAVVAEAAVAGCADAQPCRSVERLGGADRYETAAMVASWAVDRFGADSTTVHLVRGDLFADALAAGVLTGMRRSVMLLTDPAGLSPAARSWLEEHSADTEFIDVLGSPVAVSDQTWQDAEAAAD